MEKPGLSYLEMTVLPEVRNWFLASDAALLFDNSFERVLWANATAPQLLGMKDIGTLVGTAFEANHPLIRQFRAAAAQIEDDEPVVRGFRISRAGRNEIIQCVLSRFDLKGDGQGCLVTCTDQRIFRRLKDHEAAQQAIEAIGAKQEIAAIVDPFGLPLAYSQPFADADLAADEIEMITAAAMRGQDAVRRETQSSDGTRYSVTAVPVLDKPARVLLTARVANAAAGPAAAETLSRQGATVHPEAAAKGEQQDAIGIEIDDILEPADTAVPAKGEMPFPATVAEKPSIGPAATAPHAGTTFGKRARLPVETGEHGTAGLPAGGDAIRTDEGGRPPAPSMLDRWYRVEREGTGDKARTGIGINDLAPGRSGAGDALPEGTGTRNIGTEEQANQQPAGEATEPPVSETRSASLAPANGVFSFRGSAEPVRFAWTVDDNQVFLSVSPELARTVGPNAADIVGRRWSDVAKVFGFDRSGEIQRLLEKRDTWSGKSVLWPVQGTDLVAPVDLAALPAFSSARQFDGFRGFGIIRPADAVIDPDETGLALVSGPFTSSGTGFESASDAQSRKGDGGRETAGVSSPTTPANGNVVELSARKRDRGEELSKSEAKAFQEIARKLGEDLPAKTAEAPAATSSPEEDDAHAETTEPTIGLAPHRPSAQASILRQLPVPVLVYRADEILYANPELLTVTGYASERELSEAGGIEALFAGSGRLEASKGIASLRCRDGSLVDVSPLLQSVAWDDGKALLLTFRLPAAAAADEKMAIDMARVAELQNILDTATDGILITSHDGRIESLNGPAEALFGVNQAQVAGKGLEELFAKESRRTIAEYLAELREPGVASLINNGREAIGQHAKGGLIPLFITLGRIGRQEKFCAVLRDITPWKKAEEELVTARRAAETASEQKSEFLARVSHEIRTPLNAIIGFSDVMIGERFGPIENERYRGYLRDINRSGVHVLDLINDLLDISKIEAGKMELTYEAVDLNQLVSETVALLQPQANAERIIIRTSLSRAVPRVVADARSIRQIILNLVSNAIKFTPANGQVIVSTVYEGNGEVVLRVRDTGRGMTEREIEHAMKPFHQVQVTDERRGQGTGLGLPLTKALVEANRAYFDLESTPGEGTIAHVHFPTQRVLAD